MKNKTTTESPDGRFVESLVPDKRAYTVKEFCFAHGIGRTQVYEEIKYGRLIAHKCGGRTLILRGDSDAWLASLPVMNAPEGRSQSVLDKDTVG